MNLIRIVSVVKIYYNSIKNYNFLKIIEGGKYYG
jgi:hypothetical protein